MSVILVDKAFGRLSSTNINMLADSSSSTPEEDSHYYKEVAFLAQLRNSQESNVPGPNNVPGPFDFSIYALWDLRDAFENDTEPEAHHIILLRAASLWILYCADRLWANIQAQRNFVHKAFNTNNGGAGEHYVKQKKKWSSFNQERWRLWVCWNWANLDQLIRSEGGDQIPCLIELCSVEQLKYMLSLDQANPNLLPSNPVRSGQVTGDWCLIFRDWYVVITCSILLRLYSTATGSMGWNLEERWKTGMQKRWLRVHWRK